jgi:hypothetical protein
VAAANQRLSFRPKGEIFLYDFKFNEIKEGFLALLEMTSAKPLA